MKRLLFIALFVFSFMSYSFAADGDLFDTFYSSMYEGCVSSLAGYNNAKAYCSCSTDNFKKNFSAKDREELLNLAISIANKSESAQNEAIGNYMASPKIEAIITKSAESCLFILSGGR